MYKSHESLRSGPGASLKTRRGLRKELRESPHFREVPPREEGENTERLKETQWGNHTLTCSQKNQVVDRTKRSLNLGISNLFRFLRLNSVAVTSYLLLSYSH